MYYQSKQLFHLSSLIASLDKLNTVLLIIYEEAKNNNDHNTKEIGNVATKFEVNRAFFKKNLELEDNESDNKSGSKSKDDKLDNNLKNLNQPTYKSHLENNL